MKIYNIVDPPYCCIKRITIVDNLKPVDYTILSIDEDSTQIETIKALHSLNKDKVKLAFANGGDQNNKSIPEAKICKELGIELIEGLGDKIQSSSWLLKK